IGLWLLISGPMGFRPDGVVAGIASQLPTTFAAAILVLGASALNLAAGAVLARLVRRAAFPSPAETILAAFVGAVLFDVALLYGIGGLGLFRWPVVLAAHLVILAVAWRARPFLAFPLAVRLGPFSVIWAFIVVAWSGAVVLQLGSPVVPFLDVLPNHVATVEHLRTFGSWTELTTTASPIYGPSRTFLGYTALLGTIATLTGLPAGLAVSAFILPGTLLIAAGIHRLATALGGPTTGRWALLTFTLTASFARLADDRATVLVLPLAAWALATVAERLREDVPTTVERTGDGLLLGAGLGAAILVHPVVGALTIATVGLLVLARPGRLAAIGIPGMAVGAILGLPQLATMVGLALPSVLGLATLPLAELGGFVLERVRPLRVGLVFVGRVAVVAAAGAGIVMVLSQAAQAIETLGAIVLSLPILATLTVIGLLFAARTVAVPVALAALAVSAVVAVLVDRIPGQGLLVQAIQYELPKTLQYWIPVFLALTAALALDALWNATRVAMPVRAALIAVVVLVAVLPLRPAPIDLLYLGEHRLSETLAIDLRYADRGYWIGYPDTRTIVRPDQQALLDALRAEIAARRLGPDTPVLHVAESFQQWASTPLGVFVGVTETTLSPDATTNIHTVGGRLRPLSDLDTALAGGLYRYVVLEPANLADGERDRIVAAGYRSIFANARGEVFVAGL
ncbi:MAG: hypothetical protein QOE66_3188, partial [Chloroflexota bacterium]|nr:hypothetical protein [Chloroflexota bacterium]